MFNERYSTATQTDGQTAFTDTETEPAAGRL